VEGIERTKIEEEERRGNEADALSNRDCDHSLRRFLVLCSSCDHRLVLFLRIECDLCTFRGPPLLLCAHPSSPSIIDNLVFLCKVQS